MAVRVEAEPTDEGIEIKVTVGGGWADKSTYLNYYDTTIIEWSKFHYYYKRFKNRDKDHRNSG
jgi:hypothetical protein